MKTNLVREGAGNDEVCRSIVDPSAFPVPKNYTELIGKTWHDEDEKSVFVLLGMGWTSVDSNIGENIPVLVGYYADSTDVEMFALQGSTVDEIFKGGAEWSQMSEIESWIIAHEKNSTLSERARLAQ